MTVQSNVLFSPCFSRRTENWVMYIHGRAAAGGVVWCWCGVVSSRLVQIRRGVGHVSNKCMIYIKYGNTVVILVRKKSVYGYSNSSTRERERERRRTTQSHEIARQNGFRCRPSRVKPSVLSRVFPRAPIQTCCVASLPFKTSFYHPVTYYGNEEWVE